MLVTSPRQSLLSDYHGTIEQHYKKPIPILDGDTMSKEYHPMSFPSTELGCMDASAGVLYASKCLQAFQVSFNHLSNIFIHCLRKL